MYRKLTFFSRFVPDILAGRKTITLRDEAESWPHVGETLDVHTFEDDRWFCRISVEDVHPIALDALDDTHAGQENMTLAELKDVLAGIYPGRAKFWLIRFRVCDTVHS